MWFILLVLLEITIDTTIFINQNINVRIKNDGTNDKKCINGINFAC